MRLYDAQHRLQALREASSYNFDTPPSAGRVIEGLDLLTLGRILNEIDFEEVAKRKKIFNRLYQEALLSEDPAKGISFTDMLLMLAQYKLIDVNKALQYVGNLLGMVYITG